MRVKPLCHLSTKSGANSEAHAPQAQLFSALEINAVREKDDDMNAASVAHQIEVVEGDITKQIVDVIVNAANTTLLGGGGVDGAIHRADGPGLLAECRMLGGCPTGEAKITRGHQLPAKWVIHTVGPVWRDGQHGEEIKLANCYRNSLALAEQHQVRTIAFPSISTGAYGFPMERAARIAVQEVSRFLEQHRLPEKVTLVCFGAQSLEIHRRALAESLDGDS